MNTTKLKNFAQEARRQLMQQVAVRLEAALKMEGAQADENRNAIIELKSAILSSSKQVVIERVAYIWFNRLSALRFMDANAYSLVRTVSPAEGETQPEILAQAKQGIIHEDLDIERQKVIDLLTGVLPSSDGEGEAYRLLLVAVCNYYYDAMPFMFEKIADYSELLLPLDLLSDDSIVSATVSAMDAEACEEVEVIGWLYQFYISEKKDEVFASKKKVSADNIPAATQLFTPNWIVRYLVENSLGRLWMLNKPNSRLKGQMEYYIEPEQQEEDFLRVTSPEELRICDPAVGSGHMLVYAFDLLYAIYEEEGYQPSQIPKLILENNLYGVEIDERAGALAAFALTMKARQKSRRFFRDAVQANICVLENVSFTADEIDNYMAHIGKDLFTQDFWLTVRQFEEATHFGSLIRPQMTDPQTLRERLQETGVSDDIFLYGTNARMQKLLEMVDYLSAKYHVVVANPPFMGSKNMNPKLKDFLKSDYKDYKADLFASFIVRNTEFILPNGYGGYVTPFVWMFLSSYEKLREFLLSEKAICNLVKPSYTAFFESAIVALVTFVIKNEPENIKGEYIDLGYLGSAESQPIKLKEAIKDSENCDYFYRATTADFKKIPGSPIAYWVSDRVREVFDKYPPLGKYHSSKDGITTGNNDLFLRKWYEVSQRNIGFSFATRDDAMESGLTWFPCNKGGTYRRWYGNNEFVINWKNDGEAIRNFTNETGKRLSSPRNMSFYFQESVTWTDVTSSLLGVRYSPVGAISETAGPSVFSKENIITVLGLLCSKLVSNWVKVINPTLHCKPGNIAVMPWIDTGEESHSVCLQLIDVVRVDWDSYERSWDFSDLPLLRDDYQGETLADTYANLRQHWQSMTDEMQKLEEENNRIFIEAYGLGDELTPDVPLKEITLTCNPHYRYDSKWSEAKLEARLLEDTMKEFISYAVGCMFGRYALEKEGLILANQGETRVDYARLVPETAFPADVDNVIPILSDNWFADDIGERFNKFLRLTFGDANFEQNKRFIENALGVDDIRDYFLRSSRGRAKSDFYDDHVKTYNKRPIYWLFSSANNSFNALIYMHRYRPDTVSVILNDYLRKYRTNLENEVEFLQKQVNSTSTSDAEKTKALKQMEQYEAIIKELSEYEDGILYPLASRQEAMDLDDGVKVNYERFGDALYQVTGLNK